MNFESTLPVFLALIPLALGMALKVAKIPFITLRSIELITIGAIAGGVIYIQSVHATDATNLFLAGAALLSAFCVFLSQEDTEQAPALCASALITLGLALGILLNQGLVGRLFLISLLAYVAVPLIRDNHRNARSTMALLHSALAIILSLASVFGPQSMSVYASLFLALTFLPVVPLHILFMKVIEGAKGIQASFWIVVWLSIGLAELNMIYSSLTTETLFTLSLLALISAVGASLSCLGQQQYNLFIASATVAHSALVWGLLNVFPNFPIWGVPFGISVAFVMGGLCLAFSLIRQRYGWQILGKLPGLATPMPRFGMAVILFVSFAMFMPLIPTFSGLTVMPTLAVKGSALIMILFLFLAVWLGGSWYFSQMLHQTAFGTARVDVPYTDLRVVEVVALSSLLIGAVYSGLVH
ncbi:MAG: hypothetical protein G3M78_09960 [Candidatus Nitrohelix vancouverensis]|uniref:NADH:quinone oxidoreductase/Mrp antiporter membrane subunit domain-containing protein n=1 Tax=Candidatus Nitrohelix vancouverensis TaxID=2705534 RepID=A0A7T0G3S7_9BACT|nr:MAG: hypothetical protein G3M78_09960 [Candidatus Nitrohelix vancouverensis]